MNLLVLSDAFWPDHTGGISKSLLSEVEGLVALGHRVVVVTRRTKRSTSAYERRSGYDLYRYAAPPGGSPLYWTYPLFTLIQIPRLVAWLDEKFNFDVAYVHNAFQAAALVKCSRFVPYVYAFHAPTPSEVEIEASAGKYGVATPLIRIAIHWVRRKERQALAYAGAVIARSNFMIEEMKRLYNNIATGKIFRVPLGVDVCRYSFLEDPRMVRDELGLPRDRPILLTVRRLVARMGLANLIVAMGQVINQEPQALLLIGGKGYLEHSLRAQVRELNLEANIQFLGFIPENKLVKYYQAADLFVLPTLVLEGFGLSTIEALSCGTPVVATPVAANPEVLEALGKEFISGDTTPEALAERIIWFLGQNARIEIRKQCRAYCEANFRIDRVVNSIAQILEAVATRRSQRESGLQTSETDELRGDLLNPRITTLL
ncbi:MAG: glycosyltransferase family 4 protein [Candidatus Bathyarchaeia archaeon]